MLAKVEQTVDKAGEESDPRITTLLDIPSRNIHKIMRNRPTNQKVTIIFSVCDDKYMNVKRFGIIIYNFKYNNEKNFY